MPGRYIVRFKQDASDPQALSAALVTRWGGKTYGVLRSLKGFWGELPDSAIGALRRSSDVAYIEADRAIPVAGVGDTTQSNAPWQLDRVDQRNLPLNGTYEYSTTGAGVRIWIIDGGVDRSNGELAGRINESWSVTNQGKDPYGPCHPHGTNMAVAAAGTTTGPAKAAIIHAARVDSDCNGHLSVGASSFAFEFIADYSPRPTVINYSAAGHCGFFGCGQTVDDAAKYARQKGIAVFVGAGNDNDDACDYTPAHVSELITVGASNSSDQRAAISNWGTCIDIFAPTPDGGGTSRATAMVTGVAALHLQLYPTATPNQVESAIISKSTQGVLTGVGTGSPNRLLYSPQPPLISGILGPETIGPSSWCAWYRTHSGGQPPYSYEWCRNVTVVSTAPSYDTSNESSNFLIELLVTDGVGRTSFSYRSIAIDQNNTEIVCTS